MSVLTTKAKDPIVAQARELSSRNKFSSYKLCGGPSSLETDEFVLGRITFDPLTNNCSIQAINVIHTSKPDPRLLGGGVKQALDIIESPGFYTPSGKLDKNGENRSDIENEKLAFFFGIKSDAEFSTLPTFDGITHYVQIDNSIELFKDEYDMVVINGQKYFFRQGTITDGIDETDRMYLHLGTSEVEALFIYFQRQPGIGTPNAALFDADLVADALHNRIEQKDLKRDIISETQYGRLCAIGMKCMPIAEAAIKTVNRGYGTVQESIGFANGCAKANITGRRWKTLLKTSKDPKLKNDIQIEILKTGYIPAFYDATNLQQGYPATCQTWIDMSKDPPVARIPDAMPERPEISPFPIGSDIASVVLEEGKFLRFGDVRMPLCVEAISVKERPAIDVVGIMRNKGSMKRSAGHTSTQIDVSVLFRGAEEINGFTIDQNGLILEDPVTKERPILSGPLLEHFGLRPLIATFRRAPFIPVVNSTLNTKFGIDALAFVSMQLLTEDGAPGIIRANLSFIKFDYNIYLSELQSFSDAFNWPLYQKYVYNGLCVPRDKALIDRVKFNGTEYYSLYVKKLDKHDATPGDQHGHVPINTLNKLYTALVTGLYSDDLIDEVCGQYELSPKSYKLEVDEKRPKAKLKPIPSLRYDINTKTFARNNQLQGGVVFHIADEDRLQAIRNYGVQQRQNYQEALKVITDLDKKILSIDSELSNIAYEKKNLEKDIITTNLGVNEPTMAVDMIKDNLSNMFAPVESIFNRTKKPALKNYAEEKENKLKDINTKIANLNTKEKKNNDKKAKLTNELNGASRKLQEIKKIIATESEQDLIFKPFQLPADAILEGVEVLMVNNFSQQPIESRDNPTMQYIGASDTVIRLGFQCKNDTVTALHELRQHLQYLSREYRWISAKREDLTVSDLSESGEDAFIKNINDKYAGQQLETAFMLLDQEIANLCGVESVLITDIDFEKIPEAPDWYNVSINLVDFDRTQKKHETLNKIKSTGSMSSTGFSLSYTQVYGGRDKSYDEENAKAAMSNDQMRKMLFEIETYPDLDLPTMATANAWIHNIKVDAQKLKMDNIHIADHFTAPDGDPRLLEYCHVDPDFYITTGIYTSAEILLNNLSEQGIQRVDMSDEHGSGQVGHVVSNKRTTDQFNPLSVQSGNMGEAVLHIEKGKTLHNNLQSAEINLKNEKKSAGTDYLMKARQTGKDLVQSDNGTTKIDPRNSRQKYKDPNTGEIKSYPDVMLQTTGKDIFASTPEARKGDVCKPYGILGGVEFQEASLFSNFSDFYQHGKGGRLIKAFPAYWVTVVDGGRLQGQLVLNDFFYGLNGLSSLTVVKNREHPADLCMLTMSNVYGNFTNITAQRALDEGVRRKGWSELVYYMRNIFTRFPSGSDIARREQDVAGLAMQPGSRLHVRMGYGSCPIALPVIFNGTITEVPAGEGEIEIIAMGDGLELLNDTQGEPNQTLGGFFHGSEPQDMLASIIGARGGLPPSLAGGAMKRLGNWFQRMVYNVFPGFDSDNPLGISHFGNPFYKIGDEAFGECMQNIYRSNDRGARPGHTFKYDRKDDEPFDTESGNAIIRGVNPINPYSTDFTNYWPADFSQWLTFTETMSFGQKEFSTELYGKTLWDLAVISSQVSPDYICSVVPFQFRSSLFFGKPYYPYCYDYKLSQMKVPEYINGEIKWVVYGTQERHWTHKDGSTAPIDSANYNGVTSQIVAESVRYCRPTADTALKSTYVSERIADSTEAAEIKISQKFTNAQLRKPFQQVYPINSSDDIITDNITASSEGVYTVVRGKYKCKHFKITIPIVGEIGDLFAGPTDESGKGVSADMTLPVYADYTMFPENKRAITVDTQIYVGRLDYFASIMTNRDPHGNLANNVAVTILKNYMSYMYKGTITILGIPSIKPYDCVVIDDTYNELHGPVGVREVVHQMNSGSGMTSTIEPDALVSIADQRLLRNWSLFRSIGGTLAYQRLIAAEAGDTKGISNQSNLADKIKLMLALVDTYVVNNKKLMNKPDVITLYNKFKEQREVYEYLTESMETGYFVDPDYYAIANVDPAIISYDMKKYETEYYGAYDYLNNDENKRQTAEVRRDNYIIKHGKAPRLPQKVHKGKNNDDRVNLSAIEREATLKIVQEVETPNYRIPYDIGGPASSDILMTGEIIAGNSNSTEEQNLLAIITRLFDAVDMDDLIIDHAMDNLALTNREAFDWITAKQEEYSTTEKEKADKNIAFIKTWLITEEFDKKRSELQEKIEKSKTFKSILNNGKLSIQLLDMLTIARLLLDSKLKGLKVIRSDKAVSDMDKDNALTELNKAYTLMLYSCSKEYDDTEEQSKYTSIVTDYLFKEQSHVFSDSAIKLKEVTVKDVLSGPVSHIGRYWFSRLLLEGTLRSGGLYKILYNTAHASSWLVGQINGAGKWFGYGKVPKLGPGIAGPVKPEIMDIIGPQINSFTQPLSGPVRPGEKPLGSHTVNTVRSKIAKKLKEFLKLEKDSTLFEKLRSITNVKNLKQLGMEIKLASAEVNTIVKAGKAEKLIAASFGLVELSNPVGWVMLAAQVAVTAITGTLLNKLNCAMANLHACEMVLLRKHGAEFSAGINGHQGLVYGDDVNKMSRIFNELSGKADQTDEKEFEKKNILPEWGKTTLQFFTSMIGVRFPYTPEMSASEQKEHKIVDDLFNSRSFVDQSASIIKGRELLGDLGELLNAIEKGTIIGYNATPILMNEKDIKKTESADKTITANPTVVPDKPIGTKVPTVNKKADYRYVSSDLVQVINGNSFSIQEAYFKDTSKTYIPKKVSPDIRVTLAGTELPELSEDTNLEWYRSAAKAELIAMLEDQNITLDVQSIDGQYSISAIVTTRKDKNNSVNKKMIQKGFLSYKRLMNNTSADKALSDAEIEAVNSKLGIWSK